MFLEVTQLPNAHAVLHENIFSKELKDVLLDDRHLKKRHIGLFASNLVNTIRLELNNHVLSRNKCHTRRRHITVVNSVLTALLSRILRTLTLSSTRHHYTLTVNQDSPGSLWIGRWTTTSPRTFRGRNNLPRYRYLLTSLQAGRCQVNLTMVKTLKLNSLRNLYLFLEPLNPYSK